MYKGIIILILSILALAVSGCTNKDETTQPAEISPIDGAWKNLYLVDNPDPLSDYYVATKVVMENGKFTTEFFFDTSVTGNPFRIKYGDVSYSNDSLFIDEYDLDDSSLINQDILQFQRYDSSLRMRVLLHIRYSPIDTVAIDSIGIFWPAEAPVNSLGDLGEKDLGTFDIIPK